MTFGYRAFFDIFIEKTDKNNISEPIPLLHGCSTLETIAKHLPRHLHFLLGILLPDNSCDILLACLQNVHVEDVILKLTSTEIEQNKQRFFSARGTAVCALCTTQ